MNLPVIEENKASVRRHIELLDRRNLDGAIAMCAPGAIFHGFTPGPLPVEGFRQYMRLFLDTYPDARFFVGDVIAEGEKVVVRYTLRGSHQVALQDRPPYSQRALTVTVFVISIFHVVQGKIVDIWVHADFPDLMPHLDPTPAPNEIVKVPRAV